MSAAQPKHLLHQPRADEGVRFARPSENGFDLGPQPPVHRAPSATRTRNPISARMPRMITVAPLARPRDPPAGRRRNRPRRWINAAPLRAASRYALRRKTAAACVSFRRIETISLSTSSRAPLDQVEMAVRDRIERAGIDRDDARGRRGHRGITMRVGAEALIVAKSGMCEGAQCPWGRLQSSYGGRR